jgi:hypothetical protein
VEVPKAAAEAGWGEPAGGADFSQGRCRPVAGGLARCSWVWAVISQVHWSAACGVRIFGWVQPRVCLSSRKARQVETA